MAFTKYCYVTRGERERSVTRCKFYQKSILWSYGEV